MDQHSFDALQNFYQIEFAEFFDECCVGTSFE